jgi:hypothetical protein
MRADGVNPEDVVAILNLARFRSSRISQQADGHSAVSVPADPGPRDVQLAKAIEAVRQAKRCDSTTLMKEVRTAEGILQTARTTLVRLSQETWIRRWQQVGLGEGN